MTEIAVVEKTVPEKGGEYDAGEKNKSANDIECGPSDSNRYNLDRAEKLRTG